MTILVGHTGFVGSNIFAAGGIDQGFNSKNIQDAYGLEPDLLIYAGLRAEKYLANNAPEKDMELIVQAQENIRKIAPKKLVLISTIDVFKCPVGVDENTEIDCENLHPYGLNRYRLECWVRENYPDALIIRLPGLFGINLKKNFIYDYINVIPFMLKEEKMAQLVEKEQTLPSYYEKLDNGFYRVSATEDQKETLRAMFKSLGFSALNFTDSRSVYQFYNLARLWADIKTALAAGITLWHPATPPVSAGELYSCLCGGTFVNELGGAPADYDYKTVHAALFGRADGYICDKESVLRDIKALVDSAAT